MSLSSSSSSPPSFSSPPTRPTPEAEGTSVFELKHPLQGAESKLVAAIASAFVLVFVIWNAWMCDDAFITFRSIENWFAGYGLRWNPIERVQSFTHPGWMLLVAGAYSLTHDFYYTVQSLSLLLTLGALWVLFTKVASSPLHALLGALVLGFSRSFVDYSTSGLENALSHFLLALFLWAFFRTCKGAEDYLTTRSLAGLFFLASWIALNRLDAILLCLPALALAFFRAEAWDKRTFSALALATAPVWLWEIASLIYYGFFLPNTAYAKLAMGIAPRELAAQGVYYFYYTLLRDPVTALALGSAALAGLAFVRKAERRAEGALGIGIFLYLIYIVRIGGDFMGGRFFSLPLVAAVALLLRMRLHLFYHALPVAVLLVLVAERSPNPTHRSAATWRGHQGTWGIADERTFFYDGTSLAESGPGRPIPNHAWVGRGLEMRHGKEKVIVWGSLGMPGFFAGPKIHLIDPLALSDPLLARLPMQRDPNRRWRPGHFHRELPKGYKASVLGENRLEHPALRRYWDRLRLVTRGPLFSLERWKAIWGFHTGAFDADLRDFRETGYFLYEMDQFNRLRKTGQPDDLWKSLPLPLDGIGVIVRQTKDLTPRYSVSVTGGQAYKTRIIRKNRVIHEEIWVAPFVGRERLFTYQGSMPAQVFAQGFDAIKVAPLSLAKRPRIGHVLLWHTPLVVPLASLSTPRYPGTSWNAQGNLILGHQAVLRSATLLLPELSSAKRLHLAADGNDDYTIDLLHKGRLVASLLLEARPRKQGGIQTYTLALPPQASKERFDSLRFTPLQGDGAYSLAHVRLSD